MPAVPPDLGAVLDHTHEVVCLIDTAGRRVLYVNAAYEVVWGRPRADVLASPDGLALLADTVHPDDRPRSGYPGGPRLANGAEVEYRVLRPGGDVRWVRSRFRPYAGGPAGWVVGVTEDVTARKRHEDQLDAHRRELEAAYARLQEAVVTDPLTGLKNRRGLQAALLRAESAAERHGTPVSLIAADIDHFKRYNDAHGHPAGDTVLVAVATLIQRSQRPTDTAARVGGEEFVVLLPEVDRAGAVAGAERLRRAVAHARWPHRPVTASFGVATWEPGACARPDELFAAADRALYRSKHAGRNRVIHADDEPETAVEMPALGR